MSMFPRMRNNMANYTDNKPNKRAKTDLPYNSSAEQAVLGSALLNKDALYTVLSSLQEDDFFEGRHQLIYRAINQLRERGVNVDTLTATEELMNMKELDNIGGVEYLQQCCDSMVAFANLDYYIAIVNDQSCLRKLLVTLRNIDKKYHTEEIENVNDFILKSEELIKDATERRRISSFKPTSAVAPEVEGVIKSARELEDDDVTGLNTGYEGINKRTQGFQRSNLIIIAARPAVGKTALALNFAYRVATRAKTPVAIFSLEMSSELLVRRLIASESYIPLQTLSTGKLTGEQRIKLGDAVKRVINAPIYIDDTPGNKLMDIIAKSRKLQAKEPNLGLIIVDYLGLVETSGNNKGNYSRQEEVRKISLALKQLSLELKIPIIALSQLSRDVEKDKRKPQLSDLRDSGSIEQDADVVMLLHREDYGKESKNNPVANKKLGDLTEEERKKLSYGQQQQMLAEQMPGDASYVDVIIAKNRNGQTGNVPLFFYKAFGRFDTPPKEWEEKMKEIASQMDVTASN